MTRCSRTSTRGTPRREDVVDIYRAAKVGASLTRRLLSLGRQHPSGVRIVRPSLVVEELEGLLRRLVGPRVSVTIDVAPDVGSVLADQGELEEVIMNLVANARDAMPRVGALEIELANADSADDGRPESDRRRFGSTCLR